MQHTLELLWLPGRTPDRAEPRLRVRLSDGPAPASVDDVPVDFTLRVCGHARCHCLNAQLSPVPPEDGVERKPWGFPHNVWLDLEGRTLRQAPGSEEDPAFHRLDRTIRSQLTDADQQRLREWYLAEKLDLIHTAEPETIGFENLPDSSSGLMIGFIEVFPLGLTFQFRVQDEMWAVNDQFCVQPGCTCTGTILSFLKMLDGSGVPPGMIRKPPSVRYDYATRKMEPLNPWTPGTPPPGSLMDTLRRETPKLDQFLQLRHLMLQQLYLRHRLDRAVSTARSLQVIPGPKTGRNEPCPCGSGRKFKHCCLNKNRPAPE